MSSVLESFPNELLLSLFDHLDSEDLISLFAVSRRFYYFKKNYYERKIRVIIRFKTGIPLQEKLLERYVRLCNEQPTSQELDEETEVFKVEIENIEQFLEKAKHFPLFTNVTQLIFVHWNIINFTGSFGAIVNSIEYYLEQSILTWPKLRMLKLIFYHTGSDFLHLNEFIGDLFANQTNLRHLTLFCRCHSFMRERSVHNKNQIDVQVSHYEKFMKVISHLDELYIGGFNGDCFPVILPMLSEMSPNIRRLGFYYERLETCLRMLESIDNPLAGQITHLTLHSFGNDYANVDAVRSRKQLKILTNRFSALEFVSPVEAENLFEPKCKENYVKTELNE